MQMSLRLGWLPRLEGDALSWSKAHKQAKGGDGYVVTLSWNDFHDLFFF